MVRTGLTAGVLAVALLGVGLGRGQVVRAAAQESKAAAAAALSAPVNLNTATSADLEKLPGIGPALAARILEYRQKNGGFKKIEDLMNVKGIGEKSFLKLKPQITVVAAHVAER